MNTTASNAAASVRRLVRQRLESLQRAGVEQLPRRAPLALDVVTEADSSSVPPTSVPLAATTTESPPERPLPQDEAMPRGATPRSKADRETALAVIRCEVENCTRCPELAATRTQTVFGVGNPQAKVCFLGEAPGGDEDAQGEPFVGKAGQLLNKIIEACGWQREELYILNVIKCRPPGNRRPEDVEVSNCRGYFERQLEIVRPQYIVCLGATAAHALLDTTQAIGKLRGEFHSYGKAKAVVTYHPAYLLRNPAAKREVWEDMKMLMREMGQEV